MSPHTKGGIIDTLPLQTVDALQAEDALPLPTIDASGLQALIPTDCRLVVLESTDSTNDEVLRQAQLQGLVAGVPLIVLSAKQTAGRGRLGRQWTSPPGGLYLSALFELDASKAEAEGLASLSPLVALAVCEALQKLAVQPLGIKWPNDVLAAHGKVAGILVEVKPRSLVDPSSSSDASTDEQIAIIGIGINVNRPEQGAFQGAGYLDDSVTDDDGATDDVTDGETGDDVMAGEGAMTGGGSDTGANIPTLEVVAAAVISSLLQHCREWLQADCAFAQFAERYRAQMMQLGDHVSVRNAVGAEIASGLVTGIDERGRLLLEDSHGITPVSAGEVTLRR